MNSLSIRKITKSDLSTLLIFRNEDNFLNFCTNRKTVVTLDQFEREIVYDFSNDRCVQFLIHLGEIPIGTIWIYNLNEQQDYAFISTFITKKYINKGYGVYAHCRVLQFMFEEVEILRMYADVYIENELSIKTMVKRGWKFKDKINEKKFRYYTDMSNFKNKATQFANKCMYINK